MRYIVYWKVENEEMEINHCEFLTVRADNPQEAAQKVKNYIAELFEDDGLKPEMVKIVSVLDSYFVPQTCF